MVRFQFTCGRACFPQYRNWWRAVSSFILNSSLSLPTERKSRFNTWIGRVYVCIFETHKQCVIISITESRKENFEKSPRHIFVLKEEKEKRGGSREHNCWWLKIDRSAVPASHPCPGRFAWDSLQPCRSPRQLRSRPVSFVPGNRDARRLKLPSVLFSNFSMFWPCGVQQGLGRRCLSWWVRPPGNWERSRAHCRQLAPPPRWWLLACWSS